MSFEKWLKQVVFFSVAVMVFASAAGAGEEAMPREVTVQGVVSVTCDVNDMIVSVKLDADAVSYDIVLDEKGLELGREADGKKVEVIGMVAELDEKKLLTVHSYKIMEEE